MSFNAAVATLESNFTENSDAAIANFALVEFLCNLGVQWRQQEQIYYVAFLIPR